MRAGGNACFSDSPNPAHRTHNITELAESYMSSSPSLNLAEDAESPLGPVACEDPLVESDVNFLEVHHYGKHTVSMIDSNAVSVKLEQAEQVFFSRSQLRICEHYTEACADSTLTWKSSFS